MRQLELIDGNATNVLLLSNTDLTAQQLSDSYSADTIAMKGTIRGYVRINNALYGCCGSSSCARQFCWNLLRLHSEEEFKALHPSLPTIDRYEELTRPKCDGDYEAQNAARHGFYCGLLVRKGRQQFRCGPESERISVQTDGYEAAAADHREWIAAGCPSWDVWVQDHRGGNTWSRLYSSRSEAEAREHFDRYIMDECKDEFPSTVDEIAAVLLNPNGEIVAAYFPRITHRNDLVKSMSYFMDDWSENRQALFIAYVERKTICTATDTAFPTDVFGQLSLFTVN